MFLCRSWLKDDMEVDLDRESEHYTLMDGNLVISNPIRNHHEGEFTCLATNTHGTVVSQRASVQFGCKSTCAASADLQHALLALLSAHWIPGDENHDIFQTVLLILGTLVGMTTEALCICTILNVLFFSPAFSDLDLFSSEERLKVQVKEGQGAVLLCAPPPHYPGILLHLQCADCKTETK